MRTTSSRGFNLFSLAERPVFRVITFKARHFLLVTWTIVRDLLTPLPPLSEL